MSNEKPTRRGKKLWLILSVAIIIIAVVASIFYLANRPGTAPTAPSGPNVTVWDTGYCSNTGNCDYSPFSKNVTAGTNIVWTNTSGRAHTVTECTSTDSSAACSNGAGANTSNTRAFDSNTQYSSGFGKDQTFTFTFTSTGTYYYYCTLHLWMHGTTVVS